MSEKKNHYTIDVPPHLSAELWHTLTDNFEVTIKRKCHSPDEELNVSIEITDKKTK